MRINLIERVRALQAEHGVGRLEAKRMALAESAEMSADNAYDEIEGLLGTDAAHYIDELIKARISQFPR